MAQVTSPQLFSINVIIDIDCLFANIAPQLLDEFTGHPRSAKVGGEPMTAAMGAKMFFQLGGFGIMDAKGNARLTDHIDYRFFRCGATNR